MRKKEPKRGTFSKSWEFRPLRRSTKTFYPFCDSPFHIIIPSKGYKERNALKSFNFTNPPWSLCPMRAGNAAGGRGACSEHGTNCTNIDRRQFAFGECQKFAFGESQKFALGESSCEDIGLYKQTCIQGRAVRLCHRAGDPHVS